MPKISAAERLCKKPVEKLYYCMDFSARMDSTEVIEPSSPAPVVTSKIRGLESPSDLTITTVAVTGQRVCFWIEGGTDSNDYEVTVQISTDAGQILCGNGMLIVRK
jgi:hypothetical protein